MLPHIETEEMELQWEGITKKKHPIMPIIFSIHMLPKAFPFLCFFRLDYWSLNHIAINASSVVSVIKYQRRKTEFGINLSIKQFCLT